MARLHSSHAAAVLALTLVLGGFVATFIAPPAKAGVAIIFQDSFESGTLASQWTATDTVNASGFDYWGVSDYRSNAGQYSAWCAQVGNQSDTGLNNSAVQQYDDNMQADLSVDLRVSGFTSLTLSFYYYNKAESGGGDWIQAWYEANGTQTVIFTSVGTARWDLASVAVPNDVERLIIRFNSDAANHGFEGAYVDDVVLTGVENNPPSSSVSPLPAYSNVVPFQVPYTASDGSNESGIAYVELWYRNGTSGAFSLYTRPSNPLGRWYPWASSAIPFDTAFARGDGYYEFQTVAIDNASNAESPPPSADAFMTIDTVAPILNLTAPIDGAWLNTSTVTVEWQGSDALTGLDRFETAIDGGPFSTNGMATSRQFTGLSGGTHTVTVSAYDVAGNIATATVSFGVDSAIPLLAFTAPAQGAWLSASVVTATWQGTDSLSGLDHFETAIDGGPFSNAGTATSKQFTGLADGPHTLAVLAYDVAGNVATANVGFSVDTTSPTLTLTTPTEGSWVNTSAVVVTWQGSDGLSGLDHYEAMIDGGSWSTTGTAASIQFNNLTEGSHTVTVLAYDVAGNFAMAAVNFAVDTVSPLVTVLSPPSNGEERVGDVTFEWASMDATSGVDHYQFWLDDGARTNTTSANFTIDSIPDGVHTFHVIAVDLAGNQNETSVTFTVGTTTSTMALDWPWLLLLVMVIAFLLVFFVWWKNRKDERDEMEQMEAEQAEEPSGEDEAPQATEDETIGESQ